MADVAIDSAASATTELQTGDGRWQVCTDKDTIYEFFEGTGGFSYSKSTDGGATWAADVPIGSGGIIYAIWYDKWTPGNSGTVIHIWYANAVADDVFYRSLTTATDTLGTETTVVAHATMGNADTLNTLSGCRAQGGNLYVAVGINAGTDLLTFYRSTDAGANWTSRTSPMEALGDYIQLYPANLADTNDIWGVYLDVSADELSLKTYDDSANDWTSTAAETSISGAGGLVETTHTNSNSQFFGSIRLSDEHLLLAFWNAYDGATADLKFYDITNAGTITAKTDVVSNSDDCFACAVFIDQNTDDIYVGYLGKSDGSETALATVKVYYKKSTDDGTTWGSEVPYSEDTGDDFRALTCDLGGTTSLMAFAWYDDDDNDLFFGVTNSIEITAPAAAGTVGMLMMMGVGT